MTIQLVKCCDNSLNAKARVYWEHLPIPGGENESYIVTTRLYKGEISSDGGIFRLSGPLSNPRWEIRYDPGDGSIAYAYGSGYSFSHTHLTGSFNGDFYITDVNNVEVEIGLSQSLGNLDSPNTPWDGYLIITPEFPDESSEEQAVEKGYFDVELANLNIENTLVDKILKLISNVDDFLGKFIPVLGDFDKVLNIVELIKPQECLGVEYKQNQETYCLVFHKVIVLDTVTKLLDMLYQNTGIKIEIPEVIESIINSPMQLFPWVAELDEGQFITKITQQIKVICSPPGVAEYPKYKAVCCPDGNCPPAEECPPNTCAVLCGNTVCCYNKNGKLVKSFKV